MHLGGHSLAFLRRVDQLGSHGFDLLGRGFIVAHHGLGTELAYTRNPFSMLDVARQWFRPSRRQGPDGQVGQSRCNICFKLGQIIQCLGPRKLLNTCHESNLLLDTTPQQTEPMDEKIPDDSRPPRPSREISPRRIGELIENPDSWRKIRKTTAIVYRENVRPGCPAFKADDMALERPTGFEFVAVLTTARALRPPQLVPDPIARFGLRQARLR